MLRDTRRNRLVTVLVALGAFGALLTAQEGRQREGRGGPPATITPIHRVAGVRDGVSVFPKVDYAQLKPLKAGEVDFKHYHSYEETAALLKMWAAKYPDLVDLYSAGQSFEGREIWQITISNKKTGKDTDKPAFFLEGGRHAGEISGIEATLYFINHVLSGYGTDPALTALVDTKALYVRPNNNPDGNTLYHLTAQTLRSTVRPFDSDNDGLLDEDAGEDLDGDGFIRQMRALRGPGQGERGEGPEGPAGPGHAADAPGAGRLRDVSGGRGQRPATAATTRTASAGSTCTATIPRTGGRCARRPAAAMRRAERASFPLSEPETRAVFLFLMTHPNVGLAQSLDTSVPMILRGPSTASTEDGMYPEDGALALKFDKKGMEITGYPWAGDTYHVYATRGGANPLTGEPPRDSPIFGHGPDFGYSYYGVIWYGDEIWNGGRFTDYDKDGRVDEIETLPVARREPPRQGRLPGVDARSGTRSWATWRSAASTRSSGARTRRLT